MKTFTETLSAIAVFLFIFVMGYAAGVVKPADNQALEKSNSFIARVTAYCPCEKCCGDSADGITASGHRIRPGDKLAAADGRYPFGTMIEVPGYGRVPILDRGGVIKGHRIDVFFPTHKEALEWGVRALTVKVQK